MAAACSPELATNLRARSERGFLRRLASASARLQNVVMDSARPTRHLHGADVAWFAFEPTNLVERASHHADDYPGLGDKLASCRQAAWKCDCYLAFAEVGAGGVAETAVLWIGGEDLAVDLDREGNPVGIEFLDRLPCRSG
jgi:hypothetical protein